MMLIASIWTCLILHIQSKPLKPQQMSSFEGYYYHHPIYDNDKCEDCEHQEDDPPLYKYNEDPDPRIDEMNLCCLENKEDFMDKNEKVNLTSGIADIGDGDDVAKRHDNATLGDIVNILKSLSLDQLVSLQSNLSSYLNDIDRASGQGSTDNDTRDFGSAISNLEKQYSFLAHKIPSDYRLSGKLGGGKIKNVANHHAKFMNSESGRTDEHDNSAIRHNLTASGEPIVYRTRKKLSDLLQYGDEKSEKERNATIVEIERFFEELTTNNSLDELSHLKISDFKEVGTYDETDEHAFATKLLELLKIFNASLGDTHNSETKSERAGAANDDVMHNVTTEQISTTVIPTNKSDEANVTVKVTVQLNVNKVVNEAKQHEKQRQPSLSDNKGMNPAPFVAFKLMKYNDSRQDLKEANKSGKGDSPVKTEKQDSPGRTEKQDSPSKTEKQDSPSKTEKQDSPSSTSLSKESAASVNESRKASSSEWSGSGEDREGQQNKSSDSMYEELLKLTPNETSTNLSSEDSSTQTKEDNATTDESTQSSADLINEFGNGTVKNEQQNEKDLSNGYQSSAENDGNKNENFTIHNESSLFLHSPQFLQFNQTFEKLLRKIESANISDGDKNKSFSSYIMQELINELSSTESILDANKTSVGFNTFWSSYDKNDKSDKDDKSDKTDKNEIYTSIGEFLQLLRQLAFNKLGISHSTDGQNTSNPLPQLFQTLESKNKSQTLPLSTNVDEKSASSNSSAEREYSIEKLKEFLNTWRPGQHKENVHESTSKNKSEVEKNNLSRFEKLIKLLRSDGRPEAKDWKDNTYLHLSIAKFEQLFKNLLPKHTTGLINLYRDEDIKDTEIRPKLSAGHSSGKVSLHGGKKVGRENVHDNSQNDPCIIKFQKLLKLLTFKEMLKHFSHKDGDEKNDHLKLGSAFLSKVETLLKLLAFNRIFEDWNGKAAKSDSITTQKNIFIRSYKSKEHRTRSNIGIAFSRAVKSCRLQN